MVPYDNAEPLSPVPTEEPVYHILCSSVMRETNVFPESLKMRPHFGRMIYLNSNTRLFVKDFFRERFLFSFSPKNK